jgi:membrane-associated protease RseP (regulator of RpoE activity)
MNRFRGAVDWALMVALVFGAGAIAQAQDEDASGGGPVIQIGKGDVGDPDPLSRPGPTDGAIVDSPEAPKYWIGLVGGPIGPDHPLRAHVDIPENQGLLVASIVPDGPAAKAGLKVHDILLRANDTDLREMQDLVELVLSEGEKQGQITVEVLRRGQRETVYITPEERPADAPQPGSFGRAFGPGFGVPGGVEIPQDLLREFGDMPFEFRQFGPGVIVGGGEAAANLPNGVSVSIVKEDDQPARITVKRGGETWEVVGDNPESLNQLPEDLRPFVEQMLHGGLRHGMNLRGPGRAVLPELGDGRLRERLERMEQRMQELQERLLGEPNSPADEPQNEAAETK